MRLINRSSTVPIKHTKGISKYKPIPVGIPNAMTMNKGMLISQIPINPTILNMESC
jgi:hypothetical protein